MFTPRNLRFVASTLLALTAAVGCSSAPSRNAPIMAPGSGVVGAGSAAAIAAAEKAERTFTKADVDFMTGMVPHHAQAVIMSRWAITHGARTDVRRLAERIIIAQTDEIRMMRQWLGDRGQFVPDSMATRHIMRMGSMTHEVMMPGMLTDEEMAALDKARGSAFDRLYLTGMIKHHQGAIDMVHELFRQPGAGEEQTVFRFATDVEADQTAEIGRMFVMLETVPPSPQFDRRHE